ncbi:MAG: hypothetical protein EA428_15535 [Spirochaetaceae bacterium]|nr:MAG: hypothetical protein EA428_15535 [Spirochaetaceae bacterium]
MRYSSIGIIAFWLLLGLFFPVTITAQELFRSNAAGMRLEPIAPGERDQHRFVIQLVRNGEAKSERFFEHGELIRETRRLPGPAGTLREEEFSNGDLVAVRLLDAEERFISEELFSEGTLVERREYRYRGKVLVEMVIFDAAGELARRDEFHYGPGRELRAVRMVDSAGMTRNAYYSVLEGRLLEEYHEGLHGDIRVRYDEYGRTVDEVEYRAGARAVSTYYVYDSSADSFASTIREIDHERDREIVRIYTAGGDILEEAEYHAGVFERGFAYSYANGLLLERRGRGRSAALQELFDYDEDGELQRVQYLRNGQLQRERRYTNAHEYIDVLYRDSAEVLRSYYRDDRRLREEVLQNGQVVRTREFE